MKKVFFLFCIFVFIITACQNGANNQAPDPDTVGAIPNLNISYEYTSIHHPGVRVRGAVEAKVIVPFDIKREQLRPTLLSIFKDAREKYPDEDIDIFLAPSQGMMNCTQLAGRADYDGDKGKLELDYGIPTDQEMAESNAQIGKKDPFLGVDDGPRLYRPDAKTFAILDKVNYLACRKFKADKEATTFTVFPAVARKMGITAKQVKQYYFFVFDYYPQYGINSFDEKAEVLDIGKAAGN